MKSSPQSSLQTITVILLAVGLIALALGGFLAPLSRFTLSPFVQAQTWVSGRYLAIRDFLTAPRDLASLSQENQGLQGEVARLQAQVVELQQQITDLQVLSALVDFARGNPQNRYLAASVIGRDPSPFLKYVIINRGSDDGIRRGMPVVTAQGLVGRIARVTASAANVQLISDPGSVVNVTLQPSNAEAALQGSLTGDLSLNLIPQDAAVQAGDLVLTSGLGGLYPSNLVVGQVTGVRTQSTDLFQRASVQPAADFTSLDIVLVISSFRPVDISPLIPQELP
jgi:rod shape-determining protein MreC